MPQLLLLLIPLVAVLQLFLNSSLLPPGSPSPRHATGSDTGFSGGTETDALALAIPRSFVCPDSFVIKARNFLSQKWFIWPIDFDPSEQARERWREAKVTALQGVLSSPCIKQRRCCASRARPSTISRSSGAYHKTAMPLRSLRTTCAPARSVRGRGRVYL